MARAGATRDLDALRQIAQLAAPVTLAREHTMPVLDELAAVLPEGGLRRGSTVAVAGPGAVTLALALSVEVSAGGAWIVALGLPMLGLSAAQELGVALERVAFVDDPGEYASEVVSALVGAVDIVLLGPSISMRVGHTRKLAARMRERGTTVVQVRPGQHGVLQSDLTLSIESARWTGVEHGHGCLRARRVEVTTQGRGSASRPRTATLWLPGPDGKVAAIDQKVHRGSSARWERSARPRGAPSVDDAVGAAGEESAARHGDVVELARRVG